MSVLMTLMHKCLFWKVIIMILIDKIRAYALM